MLRASAEIVLIRKISSGIAKENPQQVDQRQRAFEGDALADDFLCRLGEKSAGFHGRVVGIIMHGLRRRRRCATALAADAAPLSYIL